MYPTNQIENVDALYYLKSLTYLNVSANKISNMLALVMLMDKYGLDIHEDYKHDTGIIFFANPIPEKVQQALRKGRASLISYFED